MISSYFLFDLCLKLLIYKSYARLFILRYKAWKSNLYTWIDLIEDPLYPTHHLGVACTKRNRQRKALHHKKEVHEQVSTGIGGSQRKRSEVKWFLQCGYAAVAYSGRFSGCWWLVVSGWRWCHHTPVQSCKKMQWNEMNVAEWTNECMHN